MPVLSKDTLQLVYRVIRGRGQGSRDEIEGLRTLLNVSQFKKVEPALAAAQLGWSVSLAEVGGTARGLILVTPQPLEVVINGGAAVPCGSVWFLLDTVITSLALNNNLLATPASFNVELWLVV